jgi:DNA repair exonuclease SbcCD ATPase subunit
MKSVEFTRITIIDFKEFRGGPHRLNFSKLGTGAHFMRGRNLVDKRLGSNGAGKSSIWDALTWCLFGETIEGLRGVDVRTWETKKHPMVRVDVFIDDTDHVIARSTTSNGLWLDGKVVNQETIDTLLGLTIANFPHTIVLGQGRPLFFDMRAGDKLALLSETLQLDRWEERSKLAGKIVTERESAQTRAMLELSGLERNLKTAMADLDDAKARSAQWEDERAQAQDRREQNIRIIEKALERAQLDLGDYDLKYDGAETELRHAQKQLDKANEQYSVACARYAEFGAHHDALDRERAKLELDLRDMLDGDKCPTCGQALKGDHKEHARKQRAAIKAQTDRVAKARVTWESAGKEKSAKMGVVEEFEKQVRTFREQSNLAIDGRTQAQSRVQEFKAGLAQAKQMTQDSSDKVNPYSVFVDKARKSVKNLKAAIDDKDQSIAIMEKQKARAAYWVKGFKQVRLYLLQEVLDELTAVTQTLLPQLGLDEWEIRYAMEKETKKGTTTTGLNVSIMKSGMSASAKWLSWSKGEGQRLRLLGAIALSEVLLRRAGVQCDMMVLDEPTSHLSPEGVAETVDFVIERGRENQLFYVDHQVIESSRFASVITVTRDQGGSQIDVR